MKYKRLTAFFISFYFTLPGCSSLESNIRPMSDYQYGDYYVVESICVNKVGFGRQAYFVKPDASDESFRNLGSFQEPVRNCVDERLLLTAP